MAKVTYGLWGSVDGDRSLSCDLADREVKSANGVKPRDLSTVAFADLVEGSLLNNGDAVASRV